MADGAHDHIAYVAQLADHAVSLEELEARVKALETATPQPPQPPQWPVQVPKGPQTFTANGQWIRDAVIDIAPGRAMTIADQTGKGNSVYGKGFRGCGIENVTLRGRDWGALLVDMDDFTVGENIHVVDVNYCGIAVFGGLKGTMKAPLVQRIGMLRDANGNPSIGDKGNAYGIKFEVASQAGGSSNIPTDWTVNGAVIEDSPLWMGINAHEAKNLVINDAIVRRAPRAFFFAGNIDVKLNRVQALEWTTKAGGSTDQAGILFSGATASIVGCKVSKSYAPPSTVYEVYGTATIVTATGNTIVTP